MKIRIYKLSKFLFLQQHRLVSTTALITQQEATLQSNISTSYSSKDSIDHLGSWDSAKDLPLLIDASIKAGKPIPQVGISTIGISNVQGRRLEQEDFVGFNQINPHLLYVGVFDGHGGDLCSKYCSFNLIHYLNYWLREIKTSIHSIQDIQTILHKSIIECNNGYSRWYTRFIGAQTEDQIRSPGTTATICLISQSQQLIIGHVGDSRAILCRNGQATKVTTDHIPTLITEQTRIEKSGGVIRNSRVNGRLAMTRSIGDLDFKKFGVTADPEIRTLRISHSRDAFLVLTTDGINSVMTDQEIVDTVRQAEDPKESADLLTDTAVQYSSLDNNTAIVVPLGSWNKYSRNATIFHSFGKSFTSSTRFG